MSDVFDMLLKKLKQKAKSIFELPIQNRVLTFRMLIAETDGEFEKLVEKFKELNKEKWVRLEDVKEAIQQLKQNYVLVEKSKLDDLLRQFPLQPLGLGALEMGSKLEFLNWFKRLKELLKK